jgi:two-component system response regulator DevR
MTKKHTSPIRVALVDDHTLLRETMAHILNAESDIHVVGDAAGREESLAMIEKEKPTIVLLDICLEHDNGLDMLRHLKATAPHIKCLVLTGYTEDDFILEAIQGQAHGYLMKSCTIPTLLNAIRQVANGHKTWDESILKRLTAIHSKQNLKVNEPEMDYLSPGEKEISRLVAEGLTNGEIGRKIHLAEKTIRNRVSSIMGKLYVSRRSKLAALYTESLTRKKKLM